jgi:hypothetical protein
MMIIIIKTKNKAEKNEKKKKLYKTKSLYELHIVYPILIYPNYKLQSSYI